LVLVVLILTTNHEKFTETFGLSGYIKPKDSTKLDDPRPNLSGFQEVEAKVDNDMMEEFVLKANKEFPSALGCVHISLRLHQSSTTRVMRRRSTNVCS